MAAPAMQRTPMIAGNWKMNKTADEAIDLVEEMLDDLEALDGVDVVICPPFVALYPLTDLVEGSTIFLGAQNMHQSDAGAFTGEVSPLMLETMCDYVIVGHSERRQYFGETDEAVNEKVRAAYAHHLVPILCVGESAAQRQAGETQTIVGLQLAAALHSLPPHQAREIVIAYEPIWAIGTGVACAAEDANVTIGYLRGQLRQLYSPVVSGAVRILYGGSVTPKNIDELMRQPEIDGALVGGASLKADDFVRLCARATEIKGTAGSK